MKRLVKKNFLVEFLINKKTPLSLPPNFDDLPKPISEANTDDNLDDFDIEKLLKKYVQ